MLLNFSFFFWWEGGRWLDEGGNKLSQTEAKFVVSGNLIIRGSIALKKHDKKINNAMVLSTRSTSSS